MGSTAVRCARSTATTSTKLAAAIDDVVDDVEEAIEETVMYRIEAPLEQAEALAGVLHDAARPLALALESLGRLAETAPVRLGGEAATRDATAWRRS